MRTYCDNCTQKGNSFCVSGGCVDLHPVEIRDMQDRNIEELKEEKEDGPVRLPLDGICAICDLERKGCPRCYVYKNYKRPN